MPQPNDLGRSLAALDQDSTLIAVIEMSQSIWLVTGIVPGINRQPLNSPKLIRFTELTEDEYFCSEEGAGAGVTFENSSETEPLVVLRYFGPEVNPNAPELGGKPRLQQRR